MEGYLAAVTRSGAEDALLEAQNVIYDAWEQATARSRTARKALAISPLCADAYNLLAEVAATAAEARDLYTRGIEAGELALGPAGFKEYEGHFWGFLETRPYMRARHGLALTLLELGEEEDAIGHFRAMLALNPNDNQGIRYLLLAALLRRGDTARVKALIREYADEWSAQWLYTRLLLAYRGGDAAKVATLKLAKEASSANMHVPVMLAGTKPPVPSRDGYVTIGGADEATDYVREFGQAWKDTPGAIAWLIGTAEAAPLRRRANKLPT
jgi:tetratricopeptide (TPR) repeat protein